MTFCQSVGLPLTLQQVGVNVKNDKAILEIAQRALAPGESSHKEPFAVSTDMMVDAIRAADRMGTLFHQNKAT